MIKKALKSLIRHPLVNGTNLDSPSTTLLHSQIIREKSSLNTIYAEWYRSIRSILPKNVRGPFLELGSGGSNFKKIFPDLITSEILQVPTVDVILDGQFLPFRKSALQGIVMIDVFHHLPDVEQFLTQAAFCVKPKGFMVMIEPWKTRWSSLVYGHLHHEPFLPASKSWIFPGGGPLSQSNSALPWIVFSRDREVFEKKYPEWGIKDISLHGPFSYLLSGGVAFRELVPPTIFSWFHRMELRLRPFMKHIALFARIVLVRKK